MARDDPTPPARRQIPATLPDIPEPTPGQPDDGAAEAQQLSRGLSPSDIRKEAAAESDHKRTERFRNHFETVMIVSLWILAASMAVLGAVWIWHLITPEHSYWHWLDESQIEKLQDILTGGLVAGLVADHLRRRLGRDN